MTTDWHDGEYDYCGAWCVTVAMVLSGAIRRPLRPTFADRPHTLSVMANTRLARDYARLLRPSTQTRATTMTRIGSVELYAGVAGVDFARISLTTHHAAGVVRVIYDGPVSGGQLSEVA